MKTVGEVLHEQVRVRGDADFVATETDRLTCTGRGRRNHT